MREQSLGRVQRARCRGDSSGFVYSRSLELILFQNTRNDVLAFTHTLLALDSKATNLPGLHLALISGMDASEKGEQMERGKGMHKQLQPALQGPVE